MSSLIKKSKTYIAVLCALIRAFRKAYTLGAFKEPPRDTLPKYIQIFCRKMCEAFAVDVIQVKPVPQTHGLWVSNHISWLDVPVVGSVSPVFFLSKAEIGKWPVFGKLVTAAGTLFIQRGSGDAGTVSEQIADFLKGGSSVLFFPEATTTHGHKIKKIHGKLLTSAMQANLPIQPMVTCYVDIDGNISNDAAYYGKMSMKQSLNLIINSKKIIAYVLPLQPIHPEGKTQSEITNILQERMQKGLVRLQQKVLKGQPTDAVWDEYDVSADANFDEDGSDISLNG